jgi:hypothetical protein
MLSAVNGLGYSYTSPNSYYNYFSATRHDGAAGVRIMYFVDSCTCYRFVPGAYKV